MSAELLRKLKHLHRHGPKYGLFGICTQIHVANIERGVLAHMFANWPSRSEHLSYPVPKSRTDLSAKSARSTYNKCNSGQMWDSNTEHGQLRWELLEWLIEELQK
jgi:hypothetical protein